MAAAAFGETPDAVSQLFWKPGGSMPEPTMDAHTSVRAWVPSKEAPAGTPALVSSSARHSRKRGRAAAGSAGVGLSRLSRPAPSRFSAFHSP